MIRVQVPRAGPRPLATGFTGEIEAIKTDKRLKPASVPATSVFSRYRLTVSISTAHNIPPRTLNASLRLFT